MELREKCLALNAIDEGKGKLHTIDVISNVADQYTFTNPSIYNRDDKLYINVRAVNYVLHHSKIYPMWGGRIQYLHPEDDWKLRTENFFGEVLPDTTFSIKAEPVQFQSQTPKWDFIGLEDARIVYWNDHFRLIGVRRDHIDDIGTGRMRVCTLDTIKGDSTIYKSIEEVDIPSPSDEYCEKNWSPIIDQFHSYLRWIDPVEKVEFYNILPKRVANVTLWREKVSNYNLRGNTQVIRVGDNYLTLAHSVNNWLPNIGGKDSIYRFHFVLFDQYLNILKVTEPFSMLGSNIEFSCGMCVFKDKLLISFSEQDSNALVLELDLDWIMERIKSWK